MLQDELSAFESKGRAPTEAEAYGIVNGLKNTAIKSGWLKVSHPTVPTTASDIPDGDDAFHVDGTQIAQAGPKEDKADEVRPDTVSPSEPDLGSSTYRDADRVARRIVEGQELGQIGFEREVSQWMRGFQPGASLPELEKRIADRLRPDQLEEIKDIIDAGPETPTDPETFKEIFLGLTSDDLEERLKWAREPLYQYRPQLPGKDLSNLVSIQRNISPYGGFPIEGVGHPIGTLDDHAELAAELMLSGPLSRVAGKLVARQIYRLGRQALEKIGRKNETTTGRDVATAGFGEVLTPDPRDDDPKRPLNPDLLLPPASDVPERVRSRINLHTGHRKTGWQHVVEEHFNPTKTGKSQFEIG